MFNFFNCSKDIFDQIGDDVTNILINELKFTEDNYILHHAVKKWIKDDYKSNILGNINLIIHFSVSNEYRYVYNVKVIYHKDEQVIQTKISDKVIDVNLLPIEIRKELIPNYQLTIGK